METAGRTSGVGCDLQVLPNVSCYSYDNGNVATSKTCPVCSKQFLNNIWLDKHMTMHAKSEQHYCDKCGAVFSRKSSLYYHEKNEHADKSLKKGHGNICKKYVSIGGPLTNHLPSHTHSVAQTAAQKRKQKLLKTKCLKPNSNKILTYTQVLQLLKCKFCGKCFDKEVSLSNHLRVHGALKDCHRKVSSIPEVGNSVTDMWIPTKTGKKGTSKLSIQGRKFRCNICKKRCATKAALSTHLRFHKVEPSKQRAHPADKATGGLIEADRALKTDVNTSDTLTEPIKVQKFQCHVCKKQCSTGPSFSSHLRSHGLRFSELFANEKLSDKINSSFKCTMCKVDCGSRDLLVLHSQKHKSDNISLQNIPNPTRASTQSTSSLSTHKCQECFVGFTNRSTLNKHWDSHVKIFRYTCVECGVQYRQKYRLQKHVVAHKNSFQYKCDTCTATFQSLWGLSKHKKMHSTKLLFYPCAYCKFLFRSSTILEKHIRVRHTGKQKFECSICYSQFGKKVHLIQHLALHTRQKQNEVLALSTRNVSPLSDVCHAKIGCNTGRNKFTCKLCNKIFKRKHLLKRHVRLFHCKVYCSRCHTLIPEGDSSNTSAAVCVACCTNVREKMDVDTNNSDGSPPLFRSTNFSICELATEMVTLLVDQDFLKSEGILDEPVEQQLKAIVKVCGEDEANGITCLVEESLLENLKQLIVASVGHEDAKILFQFKSVEALIVCMLTSLS